MDQTQRTATAIPAKDTHSVALTRLVAEVAGPALATSSGRYNRTYNRHNR
ncbi:MAG: YhhA family cyclophane-containing RiPP [Phenylobacterium sp.]